MRCAVLRRCALGEPEVADSRAPVEAGCGRIVFVCVIERAIVHWIDCDIAIITPAIGRGILAARAIKKMLLPRQGIQWVRHEPAGISDLWVN